MTTPSPLERAARVETEWILGPTAQPSKSSRKRAHAVLTAALDGPKDQYDCMDDVTIAVHAAICEDSPEECVEWRGACVKAVEAARAAILGEEARRG